MPSRKERHDAREAAVRALGRVLTRRAASRCELCGPEGLDVRVTEVPPIEDTPSPEAAILACARCRALLDGAPLPDHVDALRFIEGAAWSETRPVQAAAVRLLERLGAAGVAWATEAREGLWLPDDPEESA